MAAVASDWAAIGVKLVYTPEIPSAWYATWSSSTPDAVEEWGDNVGLTWQLYGLVFKPGGAFNHINGGWSDPILTSDWTTGAASASPDKYWTAMMTRFTDQAYQVPIVEWDDIVIQAKNIGGSLTPFDANAASLYEK
jgi:hypothetical protein